MGRLFSLMGRIGRGRRGGISLALFATKSKIAMLALLCLALTLSGCGGSGSSRSSEPTAIPATPTPTVIPPTPTPTPTISELFPHEAKWTYKNNSGYSFDMTLALGNPTKIPEDRMFMHPRSRDFNLGNVCSLNPKSDIVIPAYWEAKATTVGWDTPLAMGAMFSSGGAGTSNGEYKGRGVAPFSGDGRVSVAQDFSDGSKCSGFDSSDHYGYGGTMGFNVRWIDAVPNGSVRMAPFFIVVRDYYSPATPNGDTSLLDWIVIQPISAGDWDNPAMVFKPVNGSHLGFTLNGRLLRQ